MALTWDTSELLLAIRERGRLASDDPEATDEILLRAATRIMHDTIVPAVRLCRSDYYLATARIALESGKQSYGIPRRATTSSVRRVRFTDASGRECDAQPCSVEDIPVARSGETGRPRAYAIADDRIVVWPPPSQSSTYYLQIVFEYRPSALIVMVPGTSHTTVVSSSYGSPTAGRHTVIATANLFTDSSVVDIVRKDPPFSTPVIDATVDSRGAEGGGYALDLVSYMGMLENDLDLQAGDYICNAGETPVPQIPAELHPLLAAYTAAEFLSVIDPEGGAALTAEADTKMARELKIMQPRKQGAGFKMRPRVRFVGTSGRGGFGGRNTFEDL